MDSHILRKAAARLPALADLAVLRFNTRGTTSPRGTSEGAFGDGVDERDDVAAAMEFVAERGLPHPWLVGWSFGTELALKYGREHAGRRRHPAVAAAAPRDRRGARRLGRRPHAGRSRSIPELDDYLRPDEARERFARVPEVELVAVEGGKHLWVGENQTRARARPRSWRGVNPAAFPLPTEWDGPSLTRSELVLPGDDDLLDDEQDRGGDRDRDERAEDAEQRAAGERRDHDDGAGHRHRAVHDARAEDVCLDLHVDEVVDRGGDRGREPSPAKKQTSTMMTEPVIVPTSGISEKKKAMDASSDGELRADDR